MMCHLAQRSFGRVFFNHGQPRTTLGNLPESSLIGGWQNGEPEEGIGKGRTPGEGDQNKTVPHELGSPLWMKMGGPRAQLGLSRLAAGDTADWQSAIPGRRSASRDSPAYRVGLCVQIGSIACGKHFAGQNVEIFNSCPILNDPAGSRMSGRTSSCSRAMEWDTPHTLPLK
jgi:hypothetical protein